MGRELLRRRIVNFMSQAEVEEPIGSVETCPFAPHAVSGGVRPQTRSSADQWMRRLLLVPTGPPTVNNESAQRMFSQSILISATRCLLTYVLLPIVAPLVGAATGIGPVVGIPLGLLAMTFDVMAVRRFWMADHRYRWLCTGVYVIIIAFLITLMVRDIVTLAG